MARGGGHTHPRIDTSEGTDEPSVDCEMPVPQASEDYKLEERDWPSLQNSTQHTTDAPERHGGQHNTVTWADMVEAAMDTATVTGSTEVTSRHIHCDL
jgi:hypothetical protein